MTNLIEEFYEQNKDLYGDIPPNEFNLICNSPFKFTKEVISRGVLKNIRLQYLGVFEVVPSRIRHAFKNLENNFKEGKISEERYIKRKEILSTYEEV